MDAEPKRGTFRFVHQTRIAAPVDVVFAFHEAPDALQKLTPPWEKVEVVSGGGSLAVGSRVVLRTRLGPVPLNWVAGHTEYVPNKRFRDIQVSGPFASWDHVHRFDDDGHGGTLYTDEVTYRIPFGPAGRLAGRGFVERKLRRMFAHRHAVVKAACEAT